MHKFMLHEIRRLNMNFLGINFFILFNAMPFHLKSQGCVCDDNVCSIRIIFQSLYSINNENGRISLSLIAIIERYQTIQSMHT